MRERSHPFGFLCCKEPAGETDACRFTGIDFHQLLRVLVNKDMLFPQSLFDPCEAFCITIADPMQMDAVCESAERNAVFFFLDFSDKSVYIIAGSEIQFTGKLSVQCMFDGDINDCGATIDDGV